MYVFFIFENVSLFKKKKNQKSNEKGKENENEREKKGNEKCWERKR